MLIQKAGNSLKLLFSNFVQKNHGVSELCWAFYSFAISFLWHFYFYSMLTGTSMSAKVSIFAFAFLVLFLRLWFAVLIKQSD